MKIYPTTKVNAKWVITASVDLSTATARVQIDEVWHPLTWLNTSTAVGQNWVRTATAQIGGIDSGAAILLRTRQTPIVEVTVGTETLAVESGLVAVG